MDRALLGVAVTKVPMLRLATLLVLFTGCLSGTHLAKGKLYETKATAHTAWKALDGAWPALHGKTQALAIAIHSKWGEVGTRNMGSLSHAYVLRSDDGGPYQVEYPAGQPFAPPEGQAAVVELDLPSQGKSAVVLVPRSVKIVTSANPNRALDDAYARWQKYLADQKPAIDRALDAAGTASGGRPFGPETVATADGFVPTWVPGDQRFVVVFVRTYRRSSRLVERTPTAPCGKRYPFSLPSGEAGFPEEKRELVSCPQMPAYQERVHERGYAADIALVLEYDADGTRTFERAYAPEPMPTKGPF